MSLPSGTALARNIVFRNSWLMMSHKGLINNDFYFFSQSAATQFCKKKIDSNIIYLIHNSMTIIHFFFFGEHLILSTLFTNFSWHNYGNINRNFTSILNNEFNAIQNQTNNSTNPFHRILPPDHFHFCHQSKFQCCHLPVLPCTGLIPAGREGWTEWTPQHRGRWNDCKMKFFNTLRLGQDGRHFGRRHFQIQIPQ